MSDFETHTEDFADYGSPTGRRPSQPALQNFPIRTEDGAKIKSMLRDAQVTKALEASLHRGAELYDLICNHYNREGVVALLQSHNLTLDQSTESPKTDDERAVKVEWYCEVIHTIFSELERAKQPVPRTFILKAYYVSGLAPVMYKGSVLPRVRALRLFLAKHYA